MGKRAAIYVRVSTDKQTIENQLRELRQIAQRRGWEVVHEYRDAVVSGTKSRETRPGLDEMLKDAQRRRFDIVMATHPRGQLYPCAMGHTARLGFYRSTPKPLLNPVQTTVGK
jgi:predicted site-specific integrase-resolvase